ncbi:hypothetical protein ACLB2K_047286 [Fragaria x ananassa]
MKLHGVARFRRKTCYISDHFTMSISARKTKAHKANELEHVIEIRYFESVNELEPELYSSSNNLRVNLVRKTARLGGGGPKQDGVYTDLTLFTAEKHVV